MRDYTILEVSVTFSGDGAIELDDQVDPVGSERFLSVDHDTAELVAVTNEVSASLARVYRHLIDLGCIRCAKIDEYHTPRFYLVVEGEFPVQRAVGAEVNDREPGVNLGSFSEQLSTADSVGIVGQCAALPADDPAKAYSILKCMKRVDPWQRPYGCWHHGSSETLDRLPDADETLSDWCARVAVSRDQIESALSQLLLVGYDIGLFSMLFDPDEVTDTEWLVEKMIAFGVITLFVGASMAGKSSALHELLSATSAHSGPKEFLGQPITGRHAGAILCGEEKAGDFRHRQKCHGEIWDGAKPIVIRQNEPNALEDALLIFEQLPDYSAIAIDPVTSYVDGDETKAHIVSAFLNRLQSLAQRKNHAVIIAHHLVKNPPRALSQILPSVRGASVYTDRARMTIAFIDRGNGTVEAGPINYNIPEGGWLPINEGRYYRRDSETFRLLPINPALPKTRPPDAVVLDTVLQAIARFNDADIPVFQTGNSSLFKLKPAELEGRGLSRNAVETAVQALLDSRKIINTTKGLVVSVEQAKEQAT